MRLGSIEYQIQVTCDSHFILFSFSSLLFAFFYYSSNRLLPMSRGGRGGGFGRGGGGANQSGAMSLVSFDLLKDLNSGTLFNTNTDLFPVK